jgi:hypothetical protein
MVPFFFLSRKLKTSVKLIRSGDFINPPRGIISKQNWLSVPLRPQLPLMTINLKIKVFHRETKSEVET